MKLRVTMAEFTHPDNSGPFAWSVVSDQAGRLWYFISSRKVRGSLVELTYG